jgi:hypothetical protein
MKRLVLPILVMKRVAFYILCIIPVFTWAQTDSPKQVLDFTIDSSRIPTFYFHYKPLSENKYRWGLYHTEDITKSKSPFLTSTKDSRIKNSDTVFWENYMGSVGVYWVCLEATYPDSSRDTVCKRIDNNFKAYGPLPPNLLEPDSEGMPVFNIFIDNVSYYELVIFNRFGVRVFASLDSDYDWNGRVFNTGADCPDGTYYYILNYRYKDKTENEPVLNGIVRILR